MDNIENIINIRKKYAYKLCEFYNYAFIQCEPLSLTITNNLQNSLIEELEYWNKWQKRVEKLNRFNNEIKIFNDKKIYNELSQNKILELSYLRSSFEKQSDDSKKHYLIVFHKIKQNRENLIHELTYDLLSLALKEPFIYDLQLEINRTYPQLKNYCYNWKNKQMNILQTITYSIYEIELLCQSILDKLYNYGNEVNDDVNLQYFDQMQNLFFAEQCKQLSEFMEEFFNRFNVLQLLSILHSEDSLLFQKEFSDNFSNNDLGSIRNNIKIINNLSTTEKKVKIIFNTFKKLQLIFQPEINNLLEKKNKLISLSSDSPELSEITTKKWILKFQPQIFNDFDNFIENRIQFLEIN